MSKKKYYAVKKGRKTGIYENWEDANKQVNGFRGAEYKSFSSLEDAKEYMGLENKKIKSTNFNNNQNKVIAYVDGSYNDKEKIYGSGVYIIHNGVEKEFYKYGKDANFINTRNVVGEIIATLLALEYAKNKNAIEIDIHYDYDGIKKWAVEEWKTKSDIAKIYKMKLEEYKKYLSINFYKVKSHTNNPGNTKADELAKKAIDEMTNKIEFDISLYDNIDRIKKYANNINFKFENFKIEDFKLLKKLLSDNFEVENIETQNSIDSFKAKSNIFNTHLKIILYKTNTLTIQGKAHDVFIIVQEFLSKYKNYIEILQLNEEYFGTNIKETESEFETIMNNLSNFFTIEIKNLLFTAYLITKQNKEVELNNTSYKFDYSFYLMPIMRVLEAFLRSIICDKYRINCKKDSFQGVFEKNNEDLKYCFTDVARNKINNFEIENALEKCYNFYHKRHKYAHAKNNFAQTKTITDSDKVNEFIIEGIKLIKDTYDIYINNKKI
ncbi:ribonuclease H1 domain-containing protein [Marinitoga aeolica]|uniref:ribonuclease H n=1 Tax=Marinitoga aeolica TaxID=2809031 RepID=A0ABY8PPU0_9BACT|nr:viroplasmin family protein [Marinitoga aeolica]WGS64656.1 type II toxin-antitoxin system RnlA family toxin [Marinitoga aeolica]